MCNYFGKRIVVVVVSESIRSRGPGRCTPYAHVRVPEGRKKILLRACNDTTGPLFCPIFQNVSSVDRIHSRFSRSFRSTSNVINDVGHSSFDPSVAIYVLVLGHAHLYFVLYPNVSFINVSLNFFIQKHNKSIGPF